MKETEIEWGKPLRICKDRLNVRCEFKDGKWGEITAKQDEYIPLTSNSGILFALMARRRSRDSRYSAEKDGKVRVFLRMDENAKRFRSSAGGHQH